MPGGDGGALLRTLSQPNILSESGTGFWRLCHLGKVHAGRQGSLQVPGTPTTAL